MSLNPLCQICGFDLLNCFCSKLRKRLPDRIEIRETETGLRFNTGKLRWGLMHYKSMEPMIRVLMFGSEKYEDWNWAKGLNKREILECLQRHLAALMDGEEIDKESNLPHIGHVLANAMFFSYFCLPENIHKAKK